MHRFIKPAAKACFENSVSHNAWVYLPDMETSEWQSVYAIVTKNITLFQIIRAGYIILLLFYIGLRMAEAAQYQMGNFIQREGNWFLRVIGKGKNYVKSPLLKSLFEKIEIDF